MSKTKAKIECLNVPAENTAGARCDGCLFGRCVSTTLMREGVVIGTEDYCECHMARPIAAGFPRVRRDDWCSLHVQAQTKERTFCGVVSQGFQ